MGPQPWHTCCDEESGTIGVWSLRGAAVKLLATLQSSIGTAAAEIYRVHAMRDAWQRLAASCLLALESLNGARRRFAARAWSGKPSSAPDSRSVGRFQELLVWRSSSIASSRWIVPMTIAVDHPKITMPSAACIAASRRQDSSSTTSP